MNVRRASSFLLISAGIAVGAFFALKSCSPYPRIELRNFDAIPHWIAKIPCVEMNVNESAEQNLVLSVLRTVRRYDQINLAAFRYFGEDHYRITSIPDKYPPYSHQISE